MDEKKTQALVAVKPVTRTTRSRTRMTASDKAQIARIFDEDFEAIQRAMHDQLEEAYGFTRERILGRLGIKEAQGEAVQIEAEIVSLKDELMRIREELNHKISMKEQRLRILKSQALGEYDGPPEPSLLRRLDFNEDDQTNNRNWMGFPIKSKLDALVALDLKENAGVEAPAAALVAIFKSVQREFTFAASYEDAADIYRKFYSLDFRRFGVTMPPRLDSLVALTGNDLLNVGITEDPKLALPPHDAAASGIMRRGLESAERIGFKLPELPAKADR